jgi:hypothetical protein
MSKKAPKVLQSSGIASFLGLAIVLVLDYHAYCEQLAGGKSHLAPSLRLLERVDYAEGGDLLNLLEAAGLFRGNLGIAPGTMGTALPQL